VPSSVESGEVTFVVTNEGREAHGFALSAPGNSQLDERLEAGQERSFTTNLEAGTYTAYCPVQDHKQEESAEIQVE
jgi:plastocyanin